ncbi:indole-3-acetic acid-amido synthetase GH3.10-like [Nymphaea colorata]|nr:indole-3-acetic acid-amido synthetase GH3.10-like [Nymphaea colorata]XP_031477943.1 indole-3-acetic acid-amido synthetase GH3.10-like [Nymphaea colorata]
MTRKDGDGGDIIQWFEEVCREAPAVQARTLGQIIRQNSGAEYLNKWMGHLPQLHEMEDQELESLFSSFVPLSSHADYEPYIQRIADGDPSPILIQQPVTTISLSSGTTEGRPKFLLFTRHSAQSTIHMFRLAAAYRSRLFPTKPGGRILEFIYSSKLFYTTGGQKVGTATTHYFESEEFKMKQMKTETFTCSPSEVIASSDHRQSTYCHLLLGLHFSEEVEYVTSTFAYSIVEAFREFELLWREICSDIREGTLSPRITSPSMRRAVTELISPNPDLASTVEQKCMGLRKWHGVIPRLWPNAKYVYSIMTGSMLPYLNKLRHYAGGLPLIGADYGATECWVGVNTEPAAPPETVSFTVVPTFAYFEFLPLHRRDAPITSAVADDEFIEAQAVRLSQVKVGEEYEVVVTTFTGLYRYRLGDVVQVSGFHNGSPKLRFVGRRKLTLTVNIDKNTEMDVQLVVAKVCGLLVESGVELIDFTSTANLSTTPGSYVIYWELSQIPAETGLLAECCKRMDESFMDHGYVLSRKAHSIGPLKLCIVKKGTFRKILDHFVKDGASLGQFKTPRCTYNEFFIQILESCTIERIYSTGYC